MGDHRADEYLISRELDENSCSRASNLSRNNGESVSENVQIYTPTDSSVTEFQLERISLNPGESYLLPPSKTPSIIVMLDGKGNAGGHAVSRGQVYVQPAGDSLDLSIPETADSPCLLIRVHCRE